MPLKTEKPQPLLVAIFMIYLLLLGWLVLLKLQFFIPVLENGRILNLLPFRDAFFSDGIHLSEVHNNILAFLPFGLYSCMLKGGWPFWKKLLATFCVSLAFEVCQFVFAIGRADITDLITNTLGSAIGIGLYTLISRLLNDKTNRVLTILFALLTGLILLLILALLLSGRWIRIQ